MVRNRGFGRIEKEREKTSFFKILVPADLLSESMRLIPYKFEKSESKKLPLKVILKVVWGRTWAVNLSEFIGLYLMEKKGWEKFLNDNRLGDDEFLTFTDVRNNCLVVNIYDKSCKEILKPRETTINASSKDVKKEETSDIGRTRRGTKPRKERAEEEEVIADNNVKREEMSYVGPVIGECSRRGRKRKERVEEVEKRRKKKKKRAEEECERKKSKRRNKASYSSSRSAKSFSTTIKPTSLLLLTIPQPFAKKYMPKETADYIIHDPRGKQWEVTYDYNSNRQKLFSCGWRILSRGYGLHIGDQCTLTLIRPREMVLDIVRKSP